MKKSFTIYFEDLTKSAQFYLLNTFKTTKDKENWEVIPLAIITREIETKGKE